MRQTNAVLLRIQWENARGIKLGSECGNYDTGFMHSRLLNLYPIVGWGRSKWGCKGWRAAVGGKVEGLKYDMDMDMNRIRATDMFIE